MNKPQSKPLTFEQVEAGAAIAVLVMPRSSQNEVMGLQGDVIKVKLTAPPVDGAANEALIKFLAKRLDVRPSAIEIVAGRTSRQKLISIIGLSPDEVIRRLLG